MTREEAIELLIQHKQESEKDYYIKRAEALEIAIEALKHDYDNGYRKGFEIASSLKRR